MAGGCALLPAGCLIEAPPEFDEPPLPAPVIYEAWVDPPLFLPLVVDTTDPNVRSIPFNIPFQLQDTTERMLVSGWLNYGFDEPLEEPINRWPEQPDASVLSDGPAAARLFSFSVPVTELVTSAPCARLTMLLHYVNDVDLTTSLKPVDEAFEQGRVDQVHWWLVVNAAPADVSFADCPMPSGTSGDGGF